MAERRTGPGYVMPGWLIFLGVLVLLLEIRIKEWLLGSRTAQGAGTVALVVYIVGGAMLITGIILFVRALLYPRPRGPKE